VGKGARGTRSIMTSSQNAPVRNVAAALSKHGGLGFSEAGIPTRTRTRGVEKVVEAGEGWEGWCNVHRGRDLNPGLEGGGVSVD
jgi:hypothetical protein